MNINYHIKCYDITGFTVFYTMPFLSIIIYFNGFFFKKLILLFQLNSEGFFMVVSYKEVLFDFEK